jgi:hypothetical protein
MLKADQKELARAGYIKFDIDTGLGANGRTVCLITDEEKALLTKLRRIYKGSYPKDLNIEIRVSEVSEPIVYNIKCTG